MLLFLFVIQEKLLGRKDLGAKGAISLGETTLVSIWSDGQFLGPPMLVHQVPLCLKKHRCNFKILSKYRLYPSSAHESC